MKKIEKRICPRCNYLGRDKDIVCPYCGFELISDCPKCRAPIKVAFAKYCYICGYRFEKLTNSLSKKEDVDGRGTSSSNDRYQCNPGFGLKPNNKLEG